MSRHPGAPRAARRSAVLAAALGAIGIPHAALPQELAMAIDVPPAAEDLPTIIVTGARPGTPGLASVNPVTPAGDEHPSVEDYRDVVRQVFGSQGGAAPASSPIGAAYASLRNAGIKGALAGEDSAARLRNDRGAEPGGASISDRVHSLTAPASSAYGPQAISGVLDFIVNTHCSGIRTSGSYGFYSHDTAAPVHRALKAAPATFADRVSSTLQLLATTPTQRPAT
jgi:hypothetical protein